MKHALLVVLVGVASLLLVGGCTTINCQTDPPGAKVYVNGVCRGTTPFVSTFWLSEGITVVEGVLPGHEQTECPHLPTPRPVGAFLLTSAPPGAQISIDGSYVGTTPQFTPRWFFHDMRLSWAAHPAEVPVQPKPAAVEQQQQQQQQQTVIMPGGGGDKEAGQGTIIVSATPENCEVCVDGMFVGNAPTNLKLSEGVHVIEVKKEGYETFKRELRVLKGSEVVLRRVAEKIAFSRKPGDTFALRKTVKGRARLRLVVGTRKGKQVIYVTDKAVLKALGAGIGKLTPK